LTVAAPGTPSAPPGTYELGIYIHDQAADGSFPPGDQAFATTTITFFTDRLLLVNPKVSLSGGDHLVVTATVLNNSRAPMKGKVTWYLSPRADPSPWVNPAFSPAAWQDVSLAGGRQVRLSWDVIAAAPTGSYELTMWAHDFYKGQEETSDSKVVIPSVAIVNGGGFVRAVSPGVVSVVSVGSVSVPPVVVGAPMRFSVSVSLVGVGSPVVLRWDLVRAASGESSGWLSAPVLVAGEAIAMAGPVSSAVLSPEVFGVPGQGYLLRLTVLVGGAESDVVAVPAVQLVGSPVDPSIRRTSFPPVSDPLVLESVVVAPVWHAGVDPAIRATIVNTSDRAQTGQLLLQLGPVGDPTPWRDAAYSFPAAIFTIPARGVLTVAAPGTPSAPPGTYELGIYIHDQAADGSFQPGDQAFATTTITFIGSTS
jgi:hypothetical protein